MKHCERPVDRNLTRALKCVSINDGTLSKAYNLAAGVASSGLSACWAMKAVLKSLIKSHTLAIFSSCGKKVVRKWKVPFACPNPLPGTTQMPVA